MRNFIRAAAVALALALTLSGCGGALLERSYSSVSSRSAAYWEDQSEATLRAESYQDLINVLMILLERHSEEGTIRLYGEFDEQPSALAARACSEVQQETALGAYLLDYISYSGEAQLGYYEMGVRFGYRRTAEQQLALVNVTSDEGVSGMLSLALARSQKRIALRATYAAIDRARIEDDVRAVQCLHARVETVEELEAREALWTISFYPDTDAPGIVEISME